MNKDNKLKIPSNNVTFQNVIVDTFALIEQGLLHRLDKRFLCKHKEKTKPQSLIINIRLRHNIVKYLKVTLNKVSVFQLESYIIVTKDCEKM